MNNPFPHVEGEFPGGPGAQGFGFHPHARRALHEQRRQARREFRDYVRGQDAGRDGPFGPGFGPGFGRGFGPGGFGFGPGPRGRRRGRHGPGAPRRRPRRLLALLTERPMHGYEMITEIGERSEDLWRPSPGSVYPTLQLLEDEGLIAVRKAKAAKGSSS